MSYSQDLPVGMFVCHRCDVGYCVNPDHLFIGTAADNMRDASNKGRIRIPSQSFASNEDHQPAILTNAQVVEIRASQLNAWALQRTSKYPVGAAAIWAAKTRRTFRDI